MGKEGSRGLSPLAGGVGDVPFRPNPLAPFPAREGGKLGGVIGSAYEGGRRGPRGEEPPWQGVWGVSPHKFKGRGRVAPISNPATSGTQNAGKP